MERVYDSSGDDSGGGGGDSSSTAAYLKHLNKISHKISKPIRKPPVYEIHTVQSSQLEPQQSQPATAANTVAQSLQQQQAAAAPQQQQQPPVYNINKSDFRDVVQKLTGSPAHERMSTPPPIHQPKPPSSRLQRIRPPPLVQIGNRPSPLLTVAGPPLLLPGGGGGFVGVGLRPPQPQPLSPLPPFPAVHAAAESPISAYMRFLHTSFAATAADSDSKRFSTGLPPLAPLASPRWNTFAPPLPPPPPPPQPSSAAILPQFPAMPSSPLPFSCLPSPSPRSPCALLSPNLLFSPAGQLGFPQLPLSPTVPVSSPTWKGI
ncbi:PREDICTED: VQ motif-containing protein 9-like [Ipomoea nil]|uniref:VQ motif-containing protein 9-like n=1 Tax=Ipomoea nil TaxID=35883 RepID=UPI000901912A|nr:PREDICTED: VQ motif-containing protein 9-like [Ipomoea nil]